MTAGGRIEVEARGRRLFADVSPSGGVLLHGRVHGTPSEGCALSAPKVCELAELLTDAASRGPDAGERVRIVGAVDALNGRGRRVNLTVLRWYAAVGLNAHPDPTADSGWTVNCDTARELAEALRKATSDTSTQAAGTAH